MPIIPPPPMPAPPIPAPMPPGNGVTGTTHGYETSTSVVVSRWGPTEASNGGSRLKARYVQPQIAYPAQNARRLPRAATTLRTAAVSRATARVKTVSAHSKDEERRAANPTPQKATDAMRPATET